MNGLTLTLRAGLPPGRIDCAGLLPGRDLATVRIVLGNRAVPLGEVFEAAGSPGETLVLRGTDPRCDSIGEGLDGGTLTVEGDAGLHAGRGMKSGALRIMGDAGDFCCSAHPGTRRGMAGGVARVDGSVGDRSGEFIRRGIVLVGKDAGDYCGARGTAGTIVVLGQCGAFAGWSLKRASLVLARMPRSMPPGFGDAGLHALVYPGLLARRLGLDPRLFARVRRFAGDAQVEGKGEILVAAP